MFGVPAFEDGDVCAFHVFDSISGHRHLVPFPAFYHSNPAACSFGWWLMAGADLL
jgi:hypothetical protein